MTFPVNALSSALQQMQSMAAQAAGGSNTVAAPDWSATGLLPPVACAAIDCICCSADVSGFTGKVMFSPGNDDRHAGNRTDLDESIAAGPPGKPRN